MVLAVTSITGEFPASSQASRALSVNSFGMTSGQSPNSVAGLRHQFLFAEEVHSREVRNVVRLSFLAAAILISSFLNRHSLAFLLVLVSVFTSRRIPSNWSVLSRRQALIAETSRTWAAVRHANGNGRSPHCVWSCQQRANEAADGVVDRPRRAVGAIAEPCPRRHAGTVPPAALPVATRSRSPSSSRQSPWSG